MKIELHMHTSEVSPCGRAGAGELMEAYRALGYGAVVITDHYNEEIITAFPGDADQKIDRYLAGYRAAKETGARVGIEVLLGAETRIAGGAEDFLLYGIDEAFLRRHPRMYRYDQKTLFQAAEAAGALLFQAHPCRDWCRPRDAGYLHGAEVYNGSIMNENHNGQALMFAESHPRLLRSSGSDCHALRDAGRGGIAIPDHIQITSALDLCRAMLYNEYKLIEEPRETAAR